MGTEKMLAGSWHGFVSAQRKRSVPDRCYVRVIIWYAVPGILAYSEPVPAPRRLLAPGTVGLK
jgi:hypothetical protein